MYSESDYGREFATSESEYRPAFRRDYARLLHSPAFRRLQGKTQLYPGTESDFFRNRLTHSLEVAQISKTIALKINHESLDKHTAISPDLCEFAGVAHDLGHPPFGHQGEEALDECMRDWGGFEGNAQTLRILSRLEKKEIQISGVESNSESRLGLNLTYRSLASILKYDKRIPIKSSERPFDNLNKPMKGYYDSEHKLVKEIKNAVVGGNFKKKFKTVECQIMDIADDIAYSTYDLEDGFKAGFYHPVSFFSYPEKVYENVAAKVEKATGKPFKGADVKATLYDIFSEVYSVDAELYNIGIDEKGNDYAVFPSNSFTTDIANIVNHVNATSQNIAKNGNLRTILTSDLVNKAIEGIEIKVNKRFPSQSIVDLNRNLKIRVEVLKNFTYESQILSPRLKISEFRGQEIVKDIFNVLLKNDGWRLLPDDYQEIFYLVQEDDMEKRRCICDFIAGMTDQYAIEFYGRMKSENPKTIFKPF